MSLTPLTRWEKFMAKIAGQDVSISPLSRKEQFYDDIATTSSTLQTKAAATPPFSVSEPTDGQTLVYDATDEVWKNGAGGGGGGALVVNVTVADDVVTCDKTAGEMAEAYLSGTVVIAVPSEGAGFNDNYYLVVWAEWSDDGSYDFHTTIGDVYSADTASDYPASTLIT